MDKTVQMLGLATKAGKLLSGEELVIKAVQTGHASLVILSSDASENTRKKVQDKCKSYNVDLVVYGDRDTLGHAIGKEQRVVLAITDPGFANKIKELIRQ